MPLIILDRDGVINEELKAFVRSVDEWKPVAGSLDAIARLSQAGWTVAVATNQSGIGRGLFTRAALESVHDRLRAAVQSLGGSIAHIAVCPHAPEAGCRCRKPNVGLIEEIVTVTGLSALGAPFVGDSLRDMQAALAYGCAPVLVRTGYGHDNEMNARALGVAHVYRDLLEFADQATRAER